LEKRYRGKYERNRSGTPTKKYSWGKNSRGKNIGEKPLGKIIRLKTSGKIIRKNTKEKK
jgi:hypothetical protein